MSFFDPLEPGASGRSCTAEIARIFRESWTRLPTKHGVRIYRFVNVGNHLHLLIGARKRAAFQNFLREISGRIAALVTGSRKAHPIGEKGRRFWDHLVYTRIVSWGRELKAVTTYFIKNIFEAEGLLTRKGIDSGLRVVRLGMNSEKLRGLLKFAFNNFGPVIVFYAVNHFYGLKPAIAVSTIFSVGEIAYKIRKGQKITGMFKFTALITLVFGAVDLYAQQSFLFKYESAVT